MLKQVLVMFILLPLLTGIGLHPTTTWAFGDADEASSIDQTGSPEDLQVAQIARERSYAGGGDEEDLVVQESLPVPLQKIHVQTLQKRAFNNLFNRQKASAEKSKD